MPKSKALTMNQVQDLLNKPYDTFTTRDVASMKDKHERLLQDFHTTLTPEQALAGEKLESTKNKRMKIKVCADIYSKLLLVGDPPTRSRIRLDDIRRALPGIGNWKYYNTGKSVFDMEQRAFNSIISTTPLAAYAPIFQRNNRNATTDKKLERILFELLWHFRKLDHPRNAEFDELLTGSFREETSEPPRPRAARRYSYE